MTSSVSGDQLRQQRQLDLMLALGELVAVEDPHTGETHYMATPALSNMVEGRCEVESQAPARPRHAKEAPPHGWRLRAAMVVLASGIVMAAAMPAAVSLAPKMGIHRMLDEGDGDAAPVTPSPFKRRVAVLDATRVRAPVKQVLSVSAWSRFTQVFSSGSGKHRAEHISSTRSNARFDTKRLRYSDWLSSQAGGLHGWRSARFERASEMAAWSQELTHS